MTLPITVVHVVFRFGMGGMENGIVNLINRLPAGAYRHHIVSLTEFDPTFAARITAGNTDYHDLHKRRGQDPVIWWRLWRLLRRLRPGILHTRNFGTMEAHLPGWLAGVPVRVHGEHGWDVNDLLGVNERYRRARRVIGALVHRFIAVSRDLERYLVERVGIAPVRVEQIYNGVDSLRFSPAPPVRRPFTVGTIGRLQEVKNQALLVDAFAQLLAARPDLAGELRLRIVGDGPLMGELRDRVARAGCAAQVTLVGASDAVPLEMQELDLFVLPSLAEGISNTILEAMATALPVIATRVGGNVELVGHETTGLLVDSGDVQGLAQAMQRYVESPALARSHGAAGRRTVEERFSLDVMVASYDRLYRRLVTIHGTPEPLRP